MPVEMPAVREAVMESEGCQAARTQLIPTPDLLTHCPVRPAIWLLSELLEPPTNWTELVILDSRDSAPTLASGSSLSSSVNCSNQIPLQTYLNLFGIVN